MNRKETARILIQLLMTVTFISCSTKGTDIFVSPHGNDNNAGSEEMPVQTVEAAFEKAAAIRESSTKNITIHLLEGDYHLSHPLVISPDLNNLSLIGEGVDKVTVKGSKVIEANWEAFNENIWVTDIKDEIDLLSCSSMVKSKSWQGIPTLMRAVAYCKAMLKMPFQKNGWLPGKILKEVLYMPCTWGYGVVFNMKSPVLTKAENLS